jgi:hypothetical protein
MLSIQASKYEPPAVVPQSVVSVPTGTTLPVTALISGNDDTDGWTVVIYLLTAIGLWALDGAMTIMVNWVGTYLVRKNLEGNLSKTLN